MAKNITNKDVILVNLFENISTEIIQTIESIMDSPELRNNLFTFFSNYKSLKKQNGIFAYKQ